ncbi:MAG: DUF1934 domain-containing protein [Lachnospiraceae bacterium]|nr:DUF1934 domain-containing protein [Lachnospiraceae bacterium]
MTKDVLVTIKGMQFDGESGDTIETVNFAQYYLKNDGHYVIYDEVTEGESQTTKNILKLKGKLFELTKRGLVNVHMIFEEGQKTMTNYSTPFGDILMGMDTRKVEMTQVNEKKLQVQVEYALEVNYEFLADCQIVIDIEAR